MSLTTLLIIILVVLLIGGLPSVSGHNLGYAPSGMLLVLLVVLLVLMLSGRL